MNSNCRTAACATAAWCVVAEAVRRLCATGCAVAASLLAACSPRIAASPEAQSASAAAPDSVPVPGGDAGRLPVATATGEHMEVAALAVAVAALAGEGAHAVLVARHGHVVVETYAQPGAAATEVDGGEFSAVLLALLAGLARGNAGAAALPTAWDPAALQAEVERAGGGDYAALLSQRLWQPLNAATAHIRRAEGGPVRGDCCVSARAVDWLRVGILLVQQGNFEGEQVVPAAWTAAIERPLPGDPTRGLGLRLAPQGYLARNVVVLRGPGHTRMWLVPALQLVVLLVDPQSQREWSEPQALDPFIRAVEDRDALDAGGDALRRLVPNH